MNIPLKCHKLAEILDESGFKSTVTLKQWPKVIRVK